MDLQQLLQLSYRILKLSKQLVKRFLKILYLSLMTMVNRHTSPNMDGILCSHEQGRHLSGSNTRIRCHKPNTRHQLRGHGGFTLGDQHLS